MKVTIAQKHIAPKEVVARKELDIRSGDTVRVHQKIQEKGKFRIQVYEGLVIARKHGTEPGGTFTVRATLSGIGVEKTFPLYTPMIEKIEIVRRAKVRRAKLYHVRDKAAKEIKRSLRNIRAVAQRQEKEAVMAAEPEAPAEEPKEETAA